MIGNIWKPAFKMCAVLCIYFNLAGCATPAALEYAEKLANEPPTYSTITDVYFAALSDQERLRLCVLAQEGFMEEPSPATLIINLEKVKSLTDGGSTALGYANLAHSSISEGSDLKNKCEPDLEGDEKSISIVRVQVEGEKLSSAIQQQSPEELTVFVLEQNERTYFALGAPDEDFPDLTSKAYNAHAEDEASNAGYVLLPFAIVTDVVIGVVWVIFCVISGGGCIR